MTQAIDDGQGGEGKPDPERLAKEIAREVLGPLEGCPIEYPVAMRMSAWVVSQRMLPLLRTFQTETERATQAEIQQLRSERDARAEEARHKSEGLLEYMHRCDALEARLGTATRAALERAARAMCRRCAAGLPVAQGVANGEWLHAVLAHEGWPRCDASPIHTLMHERETGAEERKF